MNRIRITFIITLILSIHTNLFSESLSIKTKQTPLINRILETQDNKNNFDEIAEIINYIDDVYGNLYDTVRDGGKINIYFGPAHGKDHTENWRGITTNRIGVTGLPEEYYSIIYARKLYKLLSDNPFINVIASDEYRQVLEGKSDNYHYMKFHDVMKNAKESGAFMVIEMHMNNVAIFQKADGLINMPGIHLSRDINKRRILIDISGSYSGFLTLYNKFDAGGFSKTYALNIRDTLVAKGYKANSWEYGAVADDRFTYYLNFPVSIIYECGFISHPDEEKKLLTPAYSDGMIKTQYEMLLKTFKDIYGIDISSTEFRGNKKNYKNGIELLKLARLAIYFIKKGDSKNANLAVKIMNTHYYNSDTKDSIAYYNSIMEKINRAEKFYSKGNYYKKKRLHRKARGSYIHAKEMLNRNQMYSTYRNKYSYAIHGNKKNRLAWDEKKSFNQKTGNLSESTIYVKKSPITKPFIMTLSSNETLENAVNEALHPDSRSLEQIVRSMKSYRTVQWKKVRKYSNKKKRRISVYVKNYQDFHFKPGIFVVKLDRNLRVVKAKRVGSIYLNNNAYQNEQYLKNSHFTEIEKIKDL